MGPGIIIPLVLLAIVVPLGLMWAKQSFRGSPGDDAVSTAPSARLTSDALRSFPTPPWRIVYEIADDKLGGIGHVVIGPPGAFGMRTSMEPLPEPPDGAPDPHAVGMIAVARADLDDALARCAMSSGPLVTVHWGLTDGDREPAVELLPGHVAVDGRRLEQWADGLGGGALTSAQIDLAWQTVLTAIGRPDPLA